MISKSDLIKTLEDKKRAVLSYKIPKNIGADLGAISMFNFSVNTYLNFIYQAIQITKLKDFGKRLIQRYPYVTWLEDFVKYTGTNDKNNLIFRGYEGMIFIDDLLFKRTVINPIHNLSDYVQSAKQILNILHGEIIHHLRTINGDNLDVAPQQHTINIIVDINNNALIYNGKRFHRLNAKSLPYQLFHSAFGDNRNRYTIPLATLTEKGFKVSQIVERVESLDKDLLAKFKDIVTEGVGMGTWLIRKPSDTIELSQIFKKGN